MERVAFNVWDYVIIGITMVVSIGIGVYYRFTGGRQKTNAEYLMADRNMSTLTTAVSLMSSFMSTVTLLGVTAENYYFGGIFVLINFGYMLATPIVTRLYLPVFFGLQKTSTYEYLNLRFGPKLRTAASLAYVLQMVLYNAVVLYSPALVLEAVTGLSKTVSIFAVGIVCTIYSTIGGMKAVMVTDLFQSSIMFISVLAVLIYASVDLGGIGVVFQHAYEGGRLNFNNFNLAPSERHTWWSLILGGTVTYLSLYGVNHTQIQRLLTVRKLKSSQASVWLALPINSVMSIITCITGLAIYAVYRECDPFTAGYIAAPDQIMPYYVSIAMTSGPGLLGLFIAGVFSAALSTISSACNSLAAVTVTDYIIPLCSPRESYVTLVTKALACFYGLLFLALAFVVEQLGGVLQAALTIFAVVGGPLLGVFTLGMFTTWANEEGTIIGFVSGLVLTLWSSFGSPRPSTNYLSLKTDGCLGNFTVDAVTTTTEPQEYFYLYRVSYMWTSVMGFVCVLLVGGLCSLVWRRPHPWERAGGAGWPDAALFTPPLARRVRRQQEEAKEKKDSWPNCKQRTNIHFYRREIVANFTVQQKRLTSYREWQPEEKLDGKKSHLERSGDVLRRAARQVGELLQQISILQSMLEISHQTTSQDTTVVR